jgi:hypothetical protein
MFRKTISNGILIRQPTLIAIANQPPSCAGEEEAALIWIKIFMGELALAPGRRLHSMPEQTGG